MGKPLLILDIDETLVFASEAPLDGRTPAFQVGPYSVYKRPYIHEFLDDVSDSFDLAVWSSASASYVHGVISNLFADLSKLQFIWANDRCTRRFDPETIDYFYAKNLNKVRKLGYSLDRMLIIDDSPEKVARHYGNHLRVRPWHGEADDSELRDVLSFLAQLAKLENVRSIEKRYWRTNRPRV